MCSHRKNGKKDVFVDVIGVKGLHDGHIVVRRTLRRVSRHFLLIGSTLYTHAREA
jgi:hypothetical protein